MKKITAYTNHLFYSLVFLCSIFFFSCLGQQKGNVKTDYFKKAIEKYGFNSKYNDIINEYFEDQKLYENDEINDCEFDDTSLSGFYSYLKENFSEEKKNTFIWKYIQNIYSKAKIIEEDPEATEIEEGILVSPSSAKITYQLLSISEDRNYWSHLGKFVKEEFNCDLKLDKYLPYSLTIEKAKEIASESIPSKNSFIKIILNNFSEHLILPTEIINIISNYSDIFISKVYNYDNEHTLPIEFYEGLFTTSALCNPYSNLYFHLFFNTSNSKKEKKAPIIPLACALLGGKRVLKHVFDITSANLVDNEAESMKNRHEFTTNKLHFLIRTLKNYRGDNIDGFHTFLLNILFDSKTKDSNQDNHRYFKKLGKLISRFTEGLEEYDTYPFNLLPEHTDRSHLILTFYDRKINKLINKRIIGELFKIRSIDKNNLKSDMEVTKEANVGFTLPEENNEVSINFVKKLSSRRFSDFSIILGFKDFNDKIHLALSEYPNMDYDKETFACFNFLYFMFYINNLKNQSIINKEIIPQFYFDFLEQPNNQNLNLNEIMDKFRDRNIEYYLT